MIDENIQQSPAQTLEKFIEENNIPLKVFSPSPTTVTSPHEPYQNLAYSIYINNTAPSKKAEEETSTVLFHSKIKNANNYAPFPENLLSLGEPNALPKLASFTKFETQNNQQQAHRVCIKCFDKIRLMRIVWNKIELIQNSSLTILDIQLIKSTTTDQQWREAALYFIAQFRSLLYQFTKDKPTQIECDLLQKNAHLFTTHSCWLIPYLKSVDWENITIEEQTSVINNLKTTPQTTTPCSKLFCTTRCKPNLTLEDSIELLNELNSNIAREYLISQLPTSSETEEPLNETTIEELTCYLPLLTDLLDRDWNDILLNYLIKVSTQSDSFRYDLLRHLRFSTQTTHPQLQTQLNTYQRHILTTDPKALQNIINTENFIKLIDTTPNTTNETQIRNHYAESTIFQNYEVHQHPSDPNWTNVKARPKKEYLLPTDPNYHIQSIDYDTITTKKSANNPILLPCECIKPRNQTKHRKRNKTPPKSQIRHILFKREDLTKDHIIMNIISLIRSYPHLEMLVS